MGRRFRVVVGSTLIPRIHALVWGLWALSRAVVHRPPAEGYVRALESIAPLPLFIFWLTAGVLLIVGSIPAGRLPGRVNTVLRWGRMVGINITATLTSLWLVASIAHADFRAATSNFLIVAMAMLSAYTISRNKARRGDAPHVV